MVYFAGIARKVTDNFALPTFLLPVVGLDGSSESSQYSNSEHSNEGLEERVEVESHKQSAGPHFISRTYGCIQRPRPPACHRSLLFDLRAVDSKQEGMERC